jgi:O-antigen ligase
VLPLPYIRLLIVPALLLLAVALPASIAAMNACLGALVAVMVFGSTPEERTRFLHAALPLTPLIIALLIVYVANSAPSMKGLRPLWGLMALPLLAVYLRQVQEERWLKWFSVALLIAIAIGVMQFSGVKELTMFGLKGATRSLRASGFFVNPMTFAGIVMFSSLMFAALCIVSERRLYRVMLILSVAGLLFSITRNAWVGTLVATPLILIGHRKAVIWACVLAAISATVVLAIPRMSNRVPTTTTLTGKEAESVGARMVLWKEAIAHFRENPVFGGGFASFGERVNRNHSRQVVNLERPHAHNNLLHIAAESGLVGLLGFLSTWVWIFLRTYRSPRSAFRRGGMACIVAFMAAGMFEYNFGDSEVMIGLMAWLGLAWSAPREVVQTANSDSSSSAPTQDAVPA